jgi:hypothetical protein
VILPLFRAPPFRLPFGRRAIQAWLDAPFQYKHRNLGRSNTVHRGIVIGHG